MHARLKPCSGVVTPGSKWYLCIYFLNNVAQSVGGKRLKPFCPEKFLRNATVRSARDFHVFFSKHLVSYIGVKRIWGRGRGARTGGPLVLAGSTTRLWMSSDKLTQGWFSVFIQSRSCTEEHTTKNVNTYFTLRMFKQQALSTVLKPEDMSW
jgi:hypothetical protein